MPEYTVRADHLGARLIADEQKRQASVQAAVIEATQLGAELIAARAPHDMGMLSASVHAVGNQIVIDAPHAATLEVGARPHRAPLEPLVKWVERHHPGATEKEIKAMAWGLWHKIATVGTKPRWYVRGNLPDLGRILGACLARAKIA